MQLLNPLRKLFARLALEYVGKYIEGVSAEQFLLAAESGQISLRDVLLRLDILENVGIPLQMLFGWVGAVSVSIPFNTLFSSSKILVRIDDLSLIVGPRTNWSDEDMTRQLLLNRQRQLDEIDLEVISNFTNLKSSFLQKWVWRFAEWVVVDVRNLSIRYEDVFTASEPFTVDLQLDQLKLNTFSGLEFAGLSLRYGDSNKPLLCLTPHTLDRSQIREKLLASKRDKDRWLHVISPMTGALIVTRDVKYFLHIESVHTQVTAKIVSQLLNLAELLSEFNYAFTEIKTRYDWYRPYRPAIPVSDCPKMWWRYAVHCVLTGLALHGGSGDLHLRRGYQQCLRNARVKAWKKEYAESFGMYGGADYLKLLLPSFDLYTFHRQLREKSFAKKQQNSNFFDRIILHKQDEIFYDVEDEVFEDCIEENSVVLKTNASLEIGLLSFCIYTGTDRSVRGSSNFVQFKMANGRLESAIKGIRLQHYVKHEPKTELVSTSVSDRNELMVDYNYVSGNVIFGINNIRVYVHSEIYYELLETISNTFVSFTTVEHLVMVERLAAKLQLRMNEISNTLLILEVSNFAALCPTCTSTEMLCVFLEAGCLKTVEPRADVLVSDSIVKDYSRLSRYCLSFSGLGIRILENPIRYESLYDIEIETTDWIMKEYDFCLFVNYSIYYERKIDVQSSLFYRFLKQRYLCSREGLLLSDSAVVRTKATQMVDVEAMNVPFLNICLTSRSCCVLEKVLNRLSVSSGSVSPRKDSITADRKLSFSLLTSLSVEYIESAGSGLKIDIHRLDHHVTSTGDLTISVGSVLISSLDSRILLNINSQNDDIRTPCFMIMRESVKNEIEIVLASPVYCNFEADLMERFLTPIMMKLRAEKTHVPENDDNNNMIYKINIRHFELTMIQDRKPFSQVSIHDIDLAYDTESAECSLLMGAASVLDVSDGSEFPILIVKTLGEKLGEATFQFGNAADEAFCTLEVDFAALLCSYVHEKVFDLYNWIFDVILKILLAKPPSDNHENKISSETIPSCLIDIGKEAELLVERGRSNLSRHFTKNDNNKEKGLFFLEYYDDETNFLHRASEFNIERYKKSKNYNDIAYFKYIFKFNDLTIEVPSDTKNSKGVSVHIQQNFEIKNFLRLDSICGLMSVTSINMQGVSCKFEMSEELLKNTPLFENLNINIELYRSTCVTGAFILPSLGIRMSGGNGIFNITPRRLRVLFQIIYDNILERKTKVRRKGDIPHTRRLEYDFRWDLKNAELKLLNSQEGGDAIISLNFRNLMIDYVSTNQDYLIGLTCGQVKVLNNKAKVVLSINDRRLSRTGLNCIMYTMNYVDNSSYGTLKSCLRNDLIELLVDEMESIPDEGFKNLPIVDSYHFTKIPTNKISCVTPVKNRRFSQYSDVAEDVCNMIVLTKRAQKPEVKKVDVLVHNLEVFYCGVCLSSLQEWLLSLGQEVSSLGGLHSSSSHSEPVRSTLSENLISMELECYDSFLQMDSAGYTGKELQRTGERVYLLGVGSCVAQLKWRKKCSKTQKLRLKLTTSKSTIKCGCLNDEMKLRTLCSDFGFKVRICIIWGVEARKSAQYASTSIINNTESYLCSYVSEKLMSLRADHILSIYCSDCVFSDISILLVCPEKMEISFQDVLTLIEIFHSNSLIMSSSSSSSSRRRRKRKSSSSFSSSSDEKKRLCGSVTSVSLKLYGLRLITLNDCFDSKNVPFVQFLLSKFLVNILLFSNSVYYGKICMSLLAWFFNPTTVAFEPLTEFSDCRLSTIISRYRRVDSILCVDMNFPSKLEIDISQAFLWSFGINFEDGKKNWERFVENKYHTLSEVSDISLCVGRKMTFTPYNIINKTGMDLFVALSNEKLKIPIDEEREVAKIPVDISHPTVASPSFTVRLQKGAQSYYLDKTVFLGNDAYVHCYKILSHSISSEHQNNKNHVVGFMISYMIITGGRKKYILRSQYSLTNNCDFTLLVNKNTSIIGKTKKALPIDHEIEISIDEYKSVINLSSFFDAVHPMEKKPKPSSLLGLLCGSEIPDYHTHDNNNNNNDRVKNDDYDIICREIGEAHKTDVIPPPRVLHLKFGDRVCVLIVDISMLSYQDITCLKLDLTIRPGVLLQSTLPFIFDFEIFSQQKVDIKHRGTLKPYEKLEFFNFDLDKTLFLNLLLGKKVYTECIYKIDESKEADRNEDADAVSSGLKELFDERPNTLCYTRTQREYQNDNNSWMLWTREHSVNNDNVIERKVIDGKGIEEIRKLCIKTECNEELQFQIIVNIPNTRYRIVNNILDYPPDITLHTTCCILNCISPLSSASPLEFWVSGRDGLRYMKAPLVTKSVKYVIKDKIIYNLPHKKLLPIIDVIPLDYRCNLLTLKYQEAKSHPIPISKGTRTHIDLITRENVKYKFLVSITCTDTYPSTAYIQILPSASIINKNSSPLYMREMGGHNSCLSPDKVLCLNPWNRVLLPPMQESEGFYEFSFNMNTWGGGVILYRVAETVFDIPEDQNKHNHINVNVGTDEYGAFIITATSSPDEGLYIFKNESDIDILISQSDLINEAIPYVLLKNETIYFAWTNYCSTQLIDVNPHLLSHQCNSSTVVSSSSSKTQLDPSKDFGILKLKNNDNDNDNIINIKYYEYECLYRERKVCFVIRNRRSEKTYENSLQFNTISNKLFFQRNEFPIPNQRKSRFINMSANVSDLSSCDPNTLAPHSIIQVCCEEIVVSLTSKGRARCPISGSIEEQTLELLTLTLVTMNAKLSANDEERLLVLSVADLQLDNQRLDATYPVAIQRLTKPYSRFMATQEGCFLKHPVDDSIIDLLVLQKVQKRDLHFRWLRLILNGLSIKSDLNLISSINSLFNDIQNITKTRKNSPKIIKPFYKSKNKNVKSHFVSKGIKIIQKNKIKLIQINKNHKKDIIKSASIFIENLSIYPIIIQLSFSPHQTDSNDEFLLLWRPLFNLISGINGAYLFFDELFISQTDTRSSAILNSLTTFYSNQTWSQLSQLIASVDILGNPTQSFAHLTAGMTDFGLEPIRSLNEGKSIFEGFVTGGDSLIQNSVFGIFGGLSYFTGAASKNIVGLTLDNDYIHLHNKRLATTSPLSIVEGIQYGSSAFVQACSHGLSALVYFPIRGFNQDGVEGFLRESGRALLGSIVKPISGALEFAHKTTQGIQGGSKVNRSRKQRRRLPRMLYGVDRQIKPYNLEHAELRRYLASLEGGFWWNISFIDLVKDKTAGRITILTESHVLHVRVNKKQVVAIAEIWRIQSFIKVVSKPLRLKLQLISPPSACHLVVSSERKLQNIADMINPALPPQVATRTRLAENDS